MKLSPKKSPSVVVPNWHPDFRDLATLPDLKVVRTSFFVNVVCVTVASIAVLLTAFREYTGFSRSTEIEAAKAEMAELEAHNTELLAMNKEFNESIRRFTEAQKFMEAPFAASKLLMALGRSLPSTMDFTRIAYADGVLTLRGTIRGALDTGSSRVTAYLDVLRSEPLIGPLFPDVSLNRLDQNPRTQGLTFEILLKNPAMADKGKKGRP